jgi:putative membrane protein
MTSIYPTLAGLPNFLIYGAVGLALTFVFCVIYVRITGHDEIALIRADNTAAAIAFGSSLIGFALPLAQAIAQASTLPDCIVWGVVALVVQLGAYAVARVLVPGLSGRIEKGAIAAALVVAAVSIAAGLLNAASMTYYPTIGGVREAL